MMDQRTSPTGEIILFKNGYFEAGFCESGRRCYSAYAGAFWKINQS